MLPTSADEDRARADKIDMLSTGAWSTPDGPVTGHDVRVMYTHIVADDLPAALRVLGYKNLSDRRAERALKLLKAHRLIAFDRKWKPCRMLIGTAEPERSRDDTRVDLPVVGTGPRNRNFEKDVLATRPPPALGQTVDVLLRDGRIVRTRVERPPLCGAVWLTGIRGRVNLAQVRSVDGWFDVPRCTRQVAAIVGVD